MDFQTARQSLHHSYFVVVVVLRLMEGEEILRRLEVTKVLWGHLSILFSEATGVGTDGCTGRVITGSGDEQSPPE